MTPPLSPRWRHLSALCSLLWACALGCAARVDVFDGGLPFTPPALPNLEVLPLPRVDAGWILIEASTARIEVDPTAQDAITAVGACSDLITYCVGSSRGLDDCVASAPACLTDQPWLEKPCCPAACKAAYTGARADDPPTRSFERAFFETPDCFPGLTNALQGLP